MCISQIWKAAVKTVLELFRIVVLFLPLGLLQQQWIGSQCTVGKFKVIQLLVGIGGLPLTSLWAALTERCWVRSDSTIPPCIPALCDKRLLCFFLCVRLLVHHVVLQRMLEEFMKCFSCVAKRCLCCDSIRVRYRHRLQSVKMELTLLTVLSHVLGSLLCQDSSVCLHRCTR